MNSQTLRVLKNQRAAIISEMERLQRALDYLDAVQPLVEQVEAVTETEKNSYLQSEFKLADWRDPDAFRLTVSDKRGR